MLPFHIIEARLGQFGPDVTVPSGTTEALHALTTNPPPTELADLTNEDTFISLLSVDAAASLGIPFGSADSKYSRRIIVQEYLKFIDLSENQTVIRWGIGVRWIVNVKILNAEAKISSVPMVAASAQVGFVEATARFQVMGIGSADVTAAIPAPTDLNTETYVEFKQALIKIKNYIYATSTAIKPQVLSILGEVKDTSERAYESALAVGWALTKIAEGKNLVRAQEDYKEASAFFRDEVKSIYVEIAGTSDPTARPNDQSRAKAHRLLGSLSVRN